MREQQIKQDRPYTSIAPLFQIKKKCIKHQANPPQDHNQTLAEMPSRIEMENKEICYKT